MNRTSQPPPTKDIKKDSGSKTSAASVDDSDDKTRASQQPTTTEMSEETVVYAFDEAKNETSFFKLLDVNATNVNAAESIVVSCFLNIKLNKYNTVHWHIE